MTRTLSLASMIEQRRVLIWVGPGGVGKTTLAAASALEAARRGRRVLVVTIDPARRLADALGIGTLGGDPTAVPADRLAALGVRAPGSLAAMMLDPKRGFDDLVRRFADDEAAQRGIFENRIYQHVSDALAGSAEYAAMEKVHEMASREDFDLVVVDTPPSQHALDFLEAPQRLLEFLDSRLVQMLLHPAFAAGRLGFRLFQRSAQRVLQLIERISGVSFLEDVSEFLLAFEGMSEGFRERAHAVSARLLSEESAFVLVSGPSIESTAHAELMLARLEEHGVPLVGVVTNRVRAWPAAEPVPDAIPLPGREAEAEDALARALAAACEPGFAAREAARAAISAAGLYAALVRSDAAASGPLRARTEATGRFFRAVPELPRDVHDLEALHRLAARLFEPGPESEALR